MKGLLTPRIKVLSDASDLVRRKAREVKNLTRPASRPPALPVDTLLHEGRYCLERIIGFGGFGITYLARDGTLERQVAIKEFFPPGAARSEKDVSPGSIFPADYDEYLGKFTKEAAILARFYHPGIVPVYDVFEENRSAYIVMKYVQGPTLADLLEEQHHLVEEVALPYVIEAAGALGAVHESGIIHRDLKPENLIITPEGRVVLVDFGIALDFERGKPFAPAAGTPGYSPPEQYSCRTPLTPSSDVYALGATLYHALTGLVPLPVGDRIAGREIRLAHEVNSKISEGLSKVLSAALELDPSKRLRNMKEFIGSLQRAAGKEAAPATPGGKEIARLEGHTAWVRTVAFSPDGKLLASGGEDRAIRIWSASEAREVLRLSSQDAWVFSLAFSPLGDRLAAACYDGRILIWEMPAGVLLHRFSGKSGATSVAFSPDGKTVAAGFRDRAVGFWELPQGRELDRIECPGTAALCLSFSLDSMLATGHLVDPDIAIWRGAPFKEIARLRGHLDSVRALSFSKDRTYLASGSSDGTARIWNPLTGGEFLCLKGHRGPVHSVAFSPDGTKLASSSQDQTVRVWDVPSGRERLRLEGHRGEVQSVSFSPTAAILASVSQDQTVRLWAI